MDWGLRIPGERRGWKKALTARVGGALLSITLVFDFAFWCTHNGLWAETGFWVMGLGLVVSYISAPLRLPDWGDLLSLGTQEAVRVYWDLAALTCFSLGWVLRRSTPENPSGWLIFLSCVGLSFVTLSVWERKALSPAAAFRPRAVS